MTDPGNVTELQTGPAPLDKAALLGDTDFETGEVQVPGWGYIKVRAVSRAVALHARKLLQTKDLIDAEAFLLSKGCVEPSFTVDEVKRLAAGPHGNIIEDVVERINELSGLGGDAGPEATEQFPD